MKYIDLETYPRRSHYEFFKAMAYPYVGMTANMDVTDLIAKAKAMGKSAFLACLYVGIQAANRVPELRQRIVGDKIVEFDFCHAAHTVALPDETFCNCMKTVSCPSRTFWRTQRPGRRRPSTTTALWAPRRTKRLCCSSPASPGWPLPR